jgi:aryl-alcohol dehydrogenase
MRSVSALWRPAFATYAIAKSRNAVKVDVVAEVKKLTGGGSHYALETTGVLRVVKQSLNALRSLGTCAIVGITPEVKLDIHNDLMAEGKSMIGVIEGDSIPRVFIPQLIAYYKAGQFPFDKLIKFYNFQQINQAFEDSASGAIIKPVVKMA